MKVLHLISGGDTGGAKTHVHSLLRNLSKTVEVTMVCFMDGPFAQEARDMGIRTLVMPGNNIPRTLRSLKELIRAEGFDIIHCHGSRGNLMGALLKDASGLPVVSTVHSDYRLDYMGRPLAALTYGRLNAWALRRIKYHVGVSDAMRDLLTSRGFKCGTTFPIYNGIDFSRRAPDYDPKAFYARIGAEILPGDVVVGAAARLDPVKDLSTLIRGVALAKRSVPGMRLIIAGEGPERQALTNLARELGIADSVFFAGWIDDMDEFYESVHINALTSISETFPYAITEGAFHRLPTVSSRVGGIPMLIENGKTGYLFTAGDWETLGGQLEVLGRDEGLRKALGSAIHDRAAEEFSMDVTCRQQRLIYDEILRRKKAEENGKKRDGVLICGAYGMGNAGDEAVLEAIVGELRGINPLMPITVMSRNPAETKKNRRVDAVFTFNFPKFLRIMRKTALYINGGGSLIQDVTSRRSLWYYLYTIRAAKRRGCRVMMYGCGIGPVSFEYDRRIAGGVIDKYVDAVTLRESESLTELLSLGVKKPATAVASDPALTLPAALDRETDYKLSSCGIEPDGAYIGFCLRGWKGFGDRAEAIAACAAHAYREHGLAPVFISINHLDDGLAADMVTERLDVPYYSIREPMSSELTIGVLSRMKAVVSMRLHGLIFSAGQGVPLIAVSYDPKVTAFMESVGQESCVDLAEADAGTLCRMVDAALQKAASGEMAEAVEKLRRAESKNVEFAKMLLGETEKETVGAV